MDATLYTSIGRREVLRRVALLLGTAISTPTLVGVMQGDAAVWTVSPDAAWKPRTLTASQVELTATVAEHIIPATDTPGARAAGVHCFIDAMLSGYYAASERNRFVKGLNTLDLIAWERHLKPFMACTASQQAAFLTQLDRNVYAAQPNDARMRSAHAARLWALLRSRQPSNWFWRRMKELTLVGYYTSQVGAVLELHVDPMGDWRGDPRDASGSMAHGPAHSRGGSTGSSQT